MGLATGAVKSENGDSKRGISPLAGGLGGLMSFDSRRARLPRPLAAASQ